MIPQQNGSALLRTGSWPLKIPSFGDLESHSRTPWSAMSPVALLVVNWAMLSSVCWPWCVVNTHLYLSMMEPPSDHIVKGSLDSDLLEAQQSCLFTSVHLQNPTDLPYWFCVLGSAMVDWNSSHCPALSKSCSYFIVFQGARVEAKTWGMLGKCYTTELYPALTFQLSERLCY